MTTNPNTTVGQVAAEVPGAVHVFKTLGIDFCCGGKLPFEYDLEKRNVTVPQFMLNAQAQADARKTDPENRDFLNMSPAVLSYYIEDTHHDYLRRRMPEIDQVLIAVMRAHGANHPELFDLYKVYGKLQSELMQHLIKEETRIFPAYAQQALPDKNLVSQIMAEHEAAGALMDTMRDITNNYLIPSDACPTYQRAYTLLPELEDDLHQHIHLENNILLKGLGV